MATGAPWLARALVVSVLAHGVAAIVMRLAVHPADEKPVEIVDIEVAPPPPKAEALPAEVAKRAEDERRAREAKAQAEAEAEQAAKDAEKASTVHEPEHAEAAMDAGVDAAMDARGDAAVDARVDAASDAAAMMVASADAGGDATTQVASADAGAGDDAIQVAAATGSGSGSETATGSGSALGSGSGSGSGSGVAGAIATGSGSGAPGMTDEPAVEGAPTTAGTAANLISYFPPGHVVSALIRFDRLRGGEWAARAERLLRPLPDYHALFGDRDAAIADKLDTLVISSPRPKDATATTLVMHTGLSRSAVRDVLANPDTPIAWSAAKGGVLGKRSGKLFKGDRRVLLSPWKGWFVLAQPVDLGALTAPGSGALDAIEAKGKLPPWLDTIRTIEQESGADQRGPALVVTLAGDGKRYTFPDIGLGITSLPSPQRVSLAMELVKQGWLVRGNISFATEADAKEFETSVGAVQERIGDSHALSMLLERQHALNLVVGLSLARTGARVSYATSLSIADARVLLAAAAVTLDQYFGRAP
jgi:hypothetical protein